MTPKYIMQWRYVPYETPIEITFKPLRLAETYMTKFIIVPSIFNAKTFYMLFPLYHFYSEIRSKTLNIQQQLIYETNDVIIIKHRQNMISIYLKEKYVQDT